MKRMTATDNMIRAACASEAEALSELAFCSKAYWGYSQTFMEACRDELTYTPDQIASASLRFAVAEIHGARLGFYALEQLSSSEVELIALFVRPGAIGKGYGRALMEHALREAAAMGATSLIIQSDPNAERFYRAAGGRRIGRRESESIRGRYLPVLEIDLAATGGAGLWNCSSQVF